jgi:hypothetical protein
MIRNLLLLLFIVMLGARALQIDLSLGPGLSVKNALLYVSALLIAIESSITRNRKLELMSVIVPYCILVFYAMLTMLVIVLFLDYQFYEPRPAAIRLKTKLLDQLLMLLVFFYGVTNLKDALWLLKALIWTTMFSCFITIIDTFDIPNLGIITTREDGRVEGILASSQEFAALITFFLPLMAALWWTETGKKRKLAFLGIGLGFAALLTAASRGAIFGFVAGSTFAAFYLRRWISAKAFLRASAAGLALSLTAVALLLISDFGDVLTTRMTHGLDTGDTTTMTSGRSQNWSNILGEMFDYPLTFITGFGWESFFHSIGYHRATHSVYVDRLYNLGIIGLSLTLVLYFNSMAVARRALNGAAAEIAPFLMALVFGLAGFMIALTFSDIEAATYTWGCTGVALRLAFANRMPAAGHSDAVKSA